MGTNEQKRVVIGKNLCYNEGNQVNQGEKDASFHVQLQASHAIRL
jgi:hypothetical protein